jgi:hypothetical protein
MTDVIRRAIAKRDEDLRKENETRSTESKADDLIQCSSDGKYFFFMHEDNEPEMKKIIFSSYMEQIVKGTSSAVALLHVYLF